jgi:hypothetical protein
MSAFDDMDEWEDEDEMIFNGEDLEEEEERRGRRRGYRRYPPQRPMPYYTQITKTASGKQHRGGGGIKKYNNSLGYNPQLIYQTTGGRFFRHGLDGALYYYNTYEDVEVENPKLVVGLVHVDPKTGQPFYKGDTSYLNVQNVQTPYYSRVNENGSGKKSGSHGLDVSSKFKNGYENHPPARPPIGLPPRTFNGYPPGYTNYPNYPPYPGFY